MNTGTRVPLVILVLVSVFAVLHATRAVMLPVALALFVVTLSWPLQRWLERRRIPRVLAYFLTLLTVLFVFFLFVVMLYVCVQHVAARAPEYDQRFQEIFENGKAWAESSGLVDRLGIRGQAASLGGLTQALGSAAVWGYGMIGMFTLTLTFLIFGLVEAHRFREKLSTSELPFAHKLLEAAQEVVAALPRYMLARTVVCAATGVLVGLFTWMVGLDFPLVWAVSSFLLNFIPVLGSIVAVIPPTLFALLHPESGQFFVVLGGLTLIQFTLGNLIDPRIEGQILELSPFVVFFSIVFWGWLWGIPGALIGIPLTAVIVIVCSKFAATRGIAALLSK